MLVGPVPSGQFADFLREAQAGEADGCGPGLRRVSPLSSPGDSTLRKAPPNRKLFQGALTYQRTPGEGESPNLSVPQLLPLEWG